MDLIWLNVLRNSCTVPYLLSTRTLLLSGAVTEQCIGVTSMDHSHDMIRNLLQ